MSQEFEQVVLAKLDKINMKLDEHTVILNEHTEEFKKVNKTLDEHTENLKRLNKEEYHINNNIIKIKENIKDIGEVFEFNKDSFNKFKKRNQKDIDTLFSSLNRIDSRLDIKDTVIESLRVKNFKLENRMSDLEDEVKHIKRLAYI